MANGITISGVHAGYGSVRVLEDVSLDVRPAETVVLLGTNGNGKSTLMKCVMGLVRPARGRVVLTVDGVEYAQSLRVESDPVLPSAIVTPDEPTVPRAKPASPEPVDY